MSKGPVRTDYVPRSWQGSRVRASASVFTEAMMPELSPHSSIASPSPHSIHASVSDFWRFQRRSDTTIELPQNFKRNPNSHKLKLKLKTLTQW